MIDYATFQRIQHLHRVEQPTVAIAHAIALDARTVRRWLDEPRFRPRLSCARPSKLDPYKAYIRRLLEHHPHSAPQTLTQNSTRASRAWRSSSCWAARTTARNPPKPPATHSAAATTPMSPRTCAKMGHIGAGA